MNLLGPLISKSALFISLQIFNEEKTSSLLSEDAFSLFADAAKLNRESNAALQGLLLASAK